MTTRPGSALLTALLLPFGLAAQDTKEPAAQLDPQALLQKAMKTMAGVESLAFRTTEAQNSAMSRMIAKQTGGMMGAGQEKDVRGTYADGILRALVHDDDDEVIFCRGRQIARNDDVPWKLRRGRTVTGSKLPFLFDPEFLLETLQSLPAKSLKVRHHEKTSYKNKDVAILSATLTGQPAADLALSGALPAVESGMSGMMMRMGGAFGGGGGGMPELTVDLACYVEIATGLVHKVKVRAYKESPAAGAVQIQIQGGGGFGGDEDEDEDEDVKEKDADGKRIYKRGLPIRNLGDSLSRMSFDVVFSKFDTATIDLDEGAKRLLKVQ